MNCYNHSRNRISVLTLCRDQSCCEFSPHGW